MYVTSWEQGSRVMHRVDDIQHIGLVIKTKISDDYKAETRAIVYLYKGVFLL